MADIRYDYCIGTTNARLKKTVAAMLAEAGYYSAGEGKSIPELLRRLRSVQPWLVIVDTALPPGNIEELAEIIETDGLAASIYINTTGASTLDRYVQLTWPTDAPVLTAVADAVCTEFSRKKKLQKEIETLQTRLKERKVVEKAKGVLASHYGMSEDQSYRFLQKRSMERRLTMAEIAELVINNPGLFSSLSQRR